MCKCYKQSGAGVDFVSNYGKIAAIKILINAKIHVNFCLRTVYTQIWSAHISWLRPNKVSYEVINALFWKYSVKYGLLTQFCRVKRPLLQTYQCCVVICECFRAEELQLGQMNPSWFSLEQSPVYLTTASSSEGPLQWSDAPSGVTDHRACVFFPACWWLR